MSKWSSKSAYITNFFAMELFKGELLTVFLLQEQQLHSHPMLDITLKISCASNFAQPKYSPKAWSGRTASLLSGFSTFLFNNLLHVSSYIKNYCEMIMQWSRETKQKLQSNCMNHVVITSIIFIVYGNFFLCILKHLIEITSRCCFN